ncbi:uncharacterized protein LOC133736560 [Rosa rugosa]|uniref:uncharacterized protein LOC133736560 n=1 Tax=Rosa rugosa TaxID=74645 RepID=UPI002B417211|nr:uncharacterized protein LOC133736560 [Rosa rugosa]
MCGLKRFHRRLRFCKKIFTPLHDSMDDHWYLLVMDLHEKEALLWDSYPDPKSVGRRMHHARDVMTLMQKVFSCEMTMFGDVYYHFPSFSLTLAEGDRTNPQTFDSGIFVIRHMQHYLDPWSIGFVSEDQRNRVALEIVQSPRNEHRRVVLAAAVGGSTSVGAKNAFSPPTGRKCRSHRKRRDRTLRF